MERLEPGQELAHYRIVERLGAGGMGEVWSAVDTRLMREVALKLLPAHLATNRKRLRQLRREAKLLAALNHPNIVTIYSVEEADGIVFLAMELVDGKPLALAVPAQGCDVRRVLDLAIPMASALDAAHGRGIIHRDLTPANIMVTGDGLVKVLDFGVAKMAPVPSSADPSEDPTASIDFLSAQTGSGRSRVGTVPYMSPQQVDGEPLDTRTDIFSFGVVLYEMSTGTRPFQGNTAGTLISAILRDEPIDVDRVRHALPRQLGRIVRRCLQKKPRDRYQSARDLLNALTALRNEITTTASGSTHIPRRPILARRLSLAALVALAAVSAYVAWRVADPPATESASVATVERKMIVVLPLENLGDPADEYFAVGMTDELSSRLASVAGLGVISRGSARLYAGSRMPITELADDLGVDYVLEGSIQWEHAPEGGGRIRIIPQLTRVGDNTLMWSGRYDRVLTDLFEVQAQIAREVARELEIAIGSRTQESWRTAPTGNLEAYHAYLRGRELQRHPTYSRAQMDRAIVRFEEAIGLDPNYALAWAHLSTAHSMIYFQSDGTAARLEAASNAIERARELAPDSPAVHAAAGYYFYRARLDYERAETEFNIALADMPGDASLLAGLGYVARRLGQWDEALAKLGRAFVLDPRNAELAIGVADTLMALRRYDEAAPFIEEALSLAPNLAELWATKARNEFARTGSVPAARAAIAQAGVSDPELVWYAVELDLYERAYEVAIARLTPDVIESAGTGLGPELRVLAALALIRQGDLDEAARLLNENALFLEALLADSGPNPYARARLALTYAMLGRRQDALDQATSAVALGTTDSFSGPRFREYLAMTHSLLGDAATASAMVDELLTVPYQRAMTAHSLGLHPVWDSLRRDESILQPRD